MQVYLPADPGNGATEVIAQPGTAYPFEQELSILQRERKADASALAFGMASLVVLACTLAFIWLLCWGAVRVNAARREQLAEVDATPGAAPARSASQGSCGITSPSTTSSTIEYAMSGFAAAAAFVAFARIFSACSRRAPA